MSDLVIVYGPPFAAGNDVAWAIARAMPGKSAVFSVDSLLEGAIAVPSEEPGAELEMAHGQLRLLVAYYLKHRYHLVVEGPFLFERAGALVSYESHIDQLLALMRNLVLRSLIVQVDASEVSLRERATAAGRESEAAAALRVRAAYRPRAGAGVLAFNTGAHTAAEIAVAVQAELAKGPALDRR
jgi:hypothetical protein